jgi:hypothetical protein
MKRSSIRNNYWFLLLSSLFLQCHDDCVVQGNCTLEPNAGPCLAYFHRYYYDQQEKKCKEFIWGGCAGVVPYVTLEDCQSECGCH